MLNHIHLKFRGHEMVRLLIPLLLFPVTLTAQLTLIYPNGGEIHAPGERIEIVWDSLSPNRPVTLEYSLDNGESWRLIEDSAKRGRYLWELPAEESEHVRVRVTEVVDSAISLYVPQTNTIKPLFFRPNSTDILITGFDHTTYLADGRTGDLIREFDEPRALGSHVAFSPDGSLVALETEDGRIVLYDVESGAMIREVTELGNDFGGVKFSPDGMVIVTWGYAHSGSRWNQIVELWDVVTDTLLRSFDPGNSRITFVSFTPDSRRIAVPSADGAIFLWEIATGNLVWEATGHTKAPSYGFFSPDGTRFVSIADPDDKVGRFRNAETGELITTMPHSYTPSSLYYSRTGEFILTVISTAVGGTVLRWSGNTGEFIDTVAVVKGDFIQLLSVSDDDRYFLARSLAGAGEKDGILWDISTGSRWKTKGGHLGQVHYGGFLPGSHAFVTSDSRTFKLWPEELRSPEVDQSDGTWIIRYRSGVDEEPGRIDVLRLNLTNVPITIELLDPTTREAYQ